MKNESSFPQTPHKIGSSSIRGNISMQAAIAQACKRLQRWLAATAPQLEIQQTFERYLCWHNPLKSDNWLVELSP